MPLTDGEARMFEFFMAQFPFCWACRAAEGHRDDQYTEGLIYPRKLANHHIVGGSGRKHERWNLARLCRLCHDLYHGATVRLDGGEALPNLTFENICWLKKFHDGQWWRPEELSSLRITSFSEIELQRPPEFFEQEYARRVGANGYEWLRDFDG